MEYKAFLATNFPRYGIADHGLGVQLTDFGYRIEGLPQCVPANRYPAIPKDQCNALFLGCSWVNGGGLAYDQMFSTVLCKRLSLEYKTKWFNWNLSLGGGMMQLMSRILLSTIDFIKPDLVVFVIPGLDRRLHFRSDGRALSYAHAQGYIFENGLTNELPNKELRDYLLMNKNEIEALYELTSPYDDLSLFITHFQLIENLLENRGVAWVYSVTLGQPQIEAFELARSRGWCNNDHYLGKYWETPDVLSPTDNHPGPESNRLFANSIYDWLRVRYHDRFLNRATEILQADSA